MSHLCVWDLPVQLPQRGQGSCLTCVFGICLYSCLKEDRDHVSPVCLGSACTAASKRTGVVSHLCVWDLPVQLPQRGQGLCLTCVFGICLYSCLKEDRDHVSPVCLGSACTVASKRTGIMSHLCVFGICLYSCPKNDRDHVSPVCVWDLPVQLPQRGQGSCLTCVFGICLYSCLKEDRGCVSPVCLGSACTAASKRTGIMSHLCVWDLPVQLPQRGQGSCLTCVCLGSACTVASKRTGIMFHLCVWDLDHVSPVCVWDLPVLLPQRGQGSCLTCVCLGSACTAASKRTGIMSHLCVFGICLYCCLKEDRDHVSPVCVWDLPVLLPQRGQGSCLTCVCLGSACTAASKRTGIMSHLCVFGICLYSCLKEDRDHVSPVCLGSACTAASKRTGIMSHLCVFGICLYSCLKEDRDHVSPVCVCLGSACTAASKRTGIMSHLCVFGICLYCCLKEDRDHVSPVCVWDLPVLLPQRGQGSCLTCVCLGSACTAASKRTGIMSHLCVFGICLYCCLKEDRDHVSPVCVWDLPVLLPQRGQGSCLTCVCLGSACTAASKRTGIMSHLCVFGICLYCCLKEDRDHVSPVCVWDLPVLLPQRGQGSCLTCVCLGSACTAASKRRTALGMSPSASLLSPSSKAPGWSFRGLSLSNLYSWEGRQQHPSSHLTYVNNQQQHHSSHLTYVNNQQHHYLHLTYVNNPQHHSSHLTYVSNQKHHSSHLIYVNNQQYHSSHLTYVNNQQHHSSHLTYVNNQQQHHSSHLTYVNNPLQHQSSHLTYVNNPQQHHSSHLTYVNNQQHHSSHLTYVNNP